MLPTFFRRVNVIAQRATNALDFVGGNGNAQARAAKDNSAFRFTAHDVRADFFGNVGIIDAVFAEGADVLNLRAEFSQNFLDFLFKLNRAVVTPDCITIAIRIPSQKN